MDARISLVSLRSAALSVADLVLPRVCVVCGRPLLLGERHICTVCEADLPRTFFASLRDNPMARAFNAMVAEAASSVRDNLLPPGPSPCPCPGVDTPSGACPRTADRGETCCSTAGDAVESAGVQPYGYAAALLYYREDSPYKNIPMDLKYHRDFGEGRYFARMLGRELAASPLFADVDAVVPVPLHWLRRWKRGYNQAEVIAREVAEGVDTPSGACSRQSPPAVPVWTDVLRRVRRTRTQTRLHGGDRYANVRSAFVADAGRLASRLTEADLDVPAVQTESGATCGIQKGSRSASPARIRHLLLMDDTFTTGSTLCACERALRSALSEVLGPEAASRIRISVATLSYVGK